MKNLRDSLPSWIDSDRAAAVGSFKVSWPLKSFWSNVVNDLFSGPVSSIFQFRSLWSFLVLRQLHSLILFDVRAPRTLSGYFLTICCFFAEFVVEK